VDDLTSEAVVRRAGVFSPSAVARLTAKCRKADGLRMSNTDNMRIVAVLSCMLVSHHYIEGDGSGDNKGPVVPEKVIDRTGRIDTANRN